MLQINTAISVDGLEKSYKNLKVLNRVRFSLQKGHIDCPVNGIPGICRDFRMAACNSASIAVHTCNDLDGSHIQHLRNSINVRTGKNTDFEHKNRILEPIRAAWLAIANEVRTRIATSDKIIFIPELSFLG